MATNFIFILADVQRERANLSRRQPDGLSELRTAWQLWNDGLPAIPADASVQLAFDESELPKPTH